jgi:hypothetical protein
MTLQEFEASKHKHPCVTCGKFGVITEVDDRNGGLFLRCLSCKATKKAVWPNAPYYLKQNTRTTRKEYPFGETVEEVWARFDNLCFSCGRTSDECAAQRVARHRHHVAEYAKVGHQGPIVPICGLCHPVVTSLQKMRALVQWSRTHGELVSYSGAGVPASGVSPDPVRPAGQTPVGAVEGFPDDDADV